MKAFFVNLFTQIRQFLAVARHWPVVEPLLDLLGKERMIILLLALLGYYGIPQIPNINPKLAADLGNLVFYGGGIILTGLQVEVLIETRKQLPPSAQGIAVEMLDGLKPLKLAEVIPPTG